MNRVLLTAVCACIVAHTRPATADDPPIGRWEVEFANGVRETCEIRSDGTATVAEPQRTSPGTAAGAAGTVVITFDDDRVERWTRVGCRMLVEHWYPAAEFPQGAPVLGIADRMGEASAEDTPAPPAADLRARLEELEARNRILHAEAERLNLQLLKSLDKLLRVNPGPGVNREAELLASQLAPRLRGNPLVWRVLIATETLKDGMPLADAERLLGPPTTRTDEHVEWYFNPRGLRAAPTLRASLTGGRLSDWELARR